MIILKQSWRSKYILYSLCLIWRELLLLSVPLVEGVTYYADDATVLSSASSMTSREAYRVEVLSSSDMSEDVDSIRSRSRLELSHSDWLDISAIYVSFFVTTTDTSSSSSSLRSLLKYIMDCLLWSASAASGVPSIFQMKFQIMICPLRWSKRLSSVVWLVSDEESWQDIKLQNPFRVSSSYDEHALYCTYLDQLVVKELIRSASWRLSHPETRSKSENQTCAAERRSKVHIQTWTAYHGMVDPETFKWNDFVASDHLTLSHSCSMTHKRSILQQSGKRTTPNRTSILLRTALHWQIVLQHSEHSRQSTWYPLQNCGSFVLRFPSSTSLASERCDRWPTFASQCNFLSVELLAKALEGCYRMLVHALIANHWRTCERLDVDNVQNGHHWADVPALLTRSCLQEHDVDLFLHEEYSDVVIESTAYQELSHLMRRARTFIWDNWYLLWATLSDLTRRRRPVKADRDSNAVSAFPTSYTHQIITSQNLNRFLSPTQPLTSKSAFKEPTCILIPSERQMIGSSSVSISKLMSFTWLCNSESYTFAEVLILVRSYYATPN